MWPAPLPSSPRSPLLRLELFLSLSAWLPFLSQRSQLPCVCLLCTWGQIFCFLHPALLLGPQGFWRGRRCLRQTLDLLTSACLGDWPNFSPPACLKGDERNFQICHHCLLQGNWWMDGSVRAECVSKKFLAVGVSNFRFHHNSSVPGTPSPSSTGSSGQLLSIAGNICRGGQARLGVTGGHWPGPSPRSCNVKHV